MTTTTIALSNIKYSLRSMLEKFTPLINDYFAQVSKINKESARKESFIVLMTQLFGDDADNMKAIKRFAGGAEKTMRNIPLTNRIKTGSADTQYNNVIIEFEKDLRIKGTEAKYQLAEYLASNFKTDGQYNFTLIATDCINWVIYAPNPDSLLNKKQLTVDDIELREVQTFALTDKNSEDFYHFLDRFLFKEEKQRATLERIQEDFGELSPTFLNAMVILRGYFQQHKNKGEMSVAYEQWRKFLSIAYGSFDGNENVFLIHAYLSVFSKMLAYTVIDKDDFIDDSEVKDILTGEYFVSQNIQNFVEDDFFHWMSTPESLRALRGVFRAIANQLAFFDFNDIDEDILKGVYQELIDLETRHALGEYYTPDWLCEKIVRHGDLKQNAMILDPSCGSGSFLLASIHELKRRFPTITAEELLRQVNGIDIHPLSVQIAKTTILLAIGKDVMTLKRPAQIRVFLANTLYSPKGSVELFGGDYTVEIDKQKFKVSTQVFDDAELFDTAVAVADELAEMSKGEKDYELSVFQASLKRASKSGLPSVRILEDFHRIYKALKVAKEQKRDSIWCFMLRSIYKPYFLQNKFDCIVGNPPWFTYADIKNLEYQLRLREIAVQYNVLPKKTADMPHLEIAAIFLSYCATNFLKDDGTISFVLPRSFMSAGHHDKTRSGQVQGLALTEVWDLNNVSPLFRVPSCVLIGKKSKKSSNKIPASGITGFSVNGKIKQHNAPLSIAAKTLNFDKTEWFYTELAKRSAFSEQKTKKIKKSNAYKTEFKQGATIVPRNFYFVDITQDYKGDLKDRILTVKTSEAVLPDAKEPWKSLLMPSQPVNSNYFFRTALAKNIIPFGMIQPPIVLLPLSIDEAKRITLLDHNQLLKIGEIETAKWFKQVDKLWNSNKTEHSKDMTHLDRIDFQRGVTEQNLHKRYLVLYTASAKDANAVTIDRLDFDLEFIVESKAYVYFTDDIQEAYYVTCFLNSKTPNERIKDFQSTGLFGARDVHKTILEIPFSKYDADKKDHVDLAQLGGVCHQKAQHFITTQLDVNNYNVGRVRMEINKQLSKELEEIDKLVKKMIG